MYSNNLAETGMPTRLLRQSNLNAWSSKRPATATIAAAKTTSDDDGLILVVVELADVFRCYLFLFALILPTVEMGSIEL